MQLDILVTYFVLQLKKFGKYYKKSNIYINEYGKEDIKWRDF